MISYPFRLKFMFYNTLPGFDCCGEGRLRIAKIIKWNDVDIIFQIN